MVEWELPEERKRLTKKQWTELFQKQDGRCGNCGQRLVVKGANEVAVWDEHLVPLNYNGSNDLSNRELWCVICSRIKTSEEAPLRAKSNRVRAKHIGLPKKSKSRPFPGSKNSPWKKTFTGWKKRDE